MPKLPKKKKPKPSESFPAYINAESIAKTLIGDAVNELHEEPVVDWEAVKDGIEPSKPESPWLIPAEVDLSGLFDPPYDPKPFQCPHCLRHRHPEPLTKRQARMIDSHRMDPNYRSSEDNTPLVCVGSDYEGPVPRTSSEDKVLWHINDLVGVKWAGNINKEDMKNLTVEVVE